MKERILSHGLIIDSNARFIADLIISSGIVTQLNIPGINSEIKKRTDFTGKYIIPGPILISRHSNFNTNPPNEKFYPVSTTLVNLISDFKSIESEPPFKSDCLPVPFIDLLQIDDQVLTRLVFKDGHNMFFINHLNTEISLDKLRAIFQWLGEYGITLVILNPDKSTLDYFLSALSVSSCKLLLVPNVERLKECILCTRKSKLLAHPVYLACPCEALLSETSNIKLNGLDYSSDIFQIVSVDNKLLKKSNIELIAVLWAQMVASGKMFFEDFVDLLTIKPARFFGLSSKGTLRPGYEADLIVIDPEKSSDWFGVNKKGHIPLILRGGEELNRNNGKWIRGSLPSLVI